MSHQPGSDSAGADGLDHEPPDERVHVRVRLPFELVIGETHFPGHDLSVGGAGTAVAPRFAPGGGGRGELLIRFSGFFAAIPVGLRLVCDGAASGRGHFAFTELADAEAIVLRRVIRAHLAGRHLRLDELARDEGAQTMRVRRDHQAEDMTPPPNRLRFLGIGLGALALVAVLGVSLYQRLFVIEATFSAVTAPKIDLRAPNDGTLEAFKLKAGDRVARDRPMLRVVDGEVEADLKLAQATLDYNTRLINTLKSGAAAGGGREVFLVTENGSRASMPTVSTLSVQDAQLRIKEFESTRSFTSARIDALRTRSKQSALYSPCDCLVTWIHSEGGGYWVERGTKLAELIEAEGADVTVEALVHLDRIDEIEPNQRAWVTLPGGAVVEAKVAAIQLEGQKVSRAGFPAWARQEMSHGSVVLAMPKPLAPELVGYPVDVVFVAGDGVMIRQALAEVETFGRSVAAEAERLSGAAGAWAVTLATAAAETAQSGVERARAALGIE